MGKTGRGTHRLLASDAWPDKTSWRTTGCPASWNTPTSRKVDDHDELIVNSSGKLRAFDPKDGKELWFCDSIKAAEICPSVVAHDGIIFVFGGGKAYAVRSGGKGDITATNIVWKNEKGTNVGSAVYHDGHLYFANDGRGTAICRDAKPGDLVSPQSTIGVNLRDDLAGALQFDGAEIPKDPVVEQPTVGIITFAPGPGKDF